jgi:hypothetical protein
MRWLWKILIMTIIGCIVVLPSHVSADEFTVYSVYKALDLGNPGEIPQKDYYVNMGRTQGIREGSVLDVMRRNPTYDVVAEKLYKDVTFPIAKLKVIHVEPGASIARLEKMLTVEKTPAITPRAVMVGDLVKIAGSSE